MNLYLIRHTRTALAPGVCYGSLDVALAPESMMDIERTLSAIPPVSAVWTSTLERCLALARPLAVREGIELFCDARLVELSFGQWEGKRWEQIDRTETELWAQNYWDRAPPGGETAAALHARVGEVIAEIERSGHASVALVSHGGPIRAALSVCLGLDPCKWPQTDIGFGAVLALARRHGRWHQCATALPHHDGDV